MTPEAKRGAMHPPMPEDVRRGLHKPQVEKHPHTVRKIVAGTLAAAGIIAYANFSDDVNKFVNGIFTGGFPTVTEAATPSPTVEVTPTEAVDELVIPDGLAVEDKQVRESVKLMVNSENIFDLDINEVKSYLATGETVDLKTFEIAKDAEGKPAFVIVKGGNNGFSEEKLIFVKNGINRINEVDPLMIRNLVDNYGLSVVSSDINNKDFFVTHAGWAASYMQLNPGGLVLINPESLTNDTPRGDEYCNFNFLILLVGESRALYTSDSKYSTDKEYTTAPDKLNQNIGIDKGMFLKNKITEWHSANKTTEYEYKFGMSTCNSIIAHYSQN